MPSESKITISKADDYLDAEHAEVPGDSQCMPDAADPHYGEAMGARLCITVIADIYGFFSLYYLDSTTRRYPDPIVNTRNPFNPADTGVRLLKTLTYLELVFGLSGLFAASLWLCLKIVTEADIPSQRNFAGSPWNWIKLHWNASLIMCGICVVLQLPLLGWIARDVLAL